ncbi:MAG: peptidylprolyl isomerase [Planctomycetaceae bacterium]
MKPLLFSLLAACLTFPAIAQETPKAAAVPETFQVRFETSCGDFVVEVQRKWAPKGADRFHQLVTAGYYDECRFFRVVPDFVVQWGINGNPAVYAKWKDNEIADDPVVQSNLTGFVTFATKGPDTRTCQLFINTADNERLDALGFAPFGKVVEGMDVVKKINAEYGQKPNQLLIQEQGNEYLKSSFPKLDYIRKATVIPVK